jgi:hypothetical protein
MKDKRMKTMKTTSNLNTWTLVAGGVIALCLGSSHASAGELGNLLDKSKAYAALPAVKHTPAFRLEPIQPAEHAKGTEWFYVCDGDERIGLIQTWTKEIEMFQFSQQVANGGKYEIPKIYHWGNLYGARIQMFGTQMLPPVESFKLTFAKDRGDSLELAVENRHKGDIRGTGAFRLGWDERLGYVWNCVSRYSMPKPAKIEFNNLFAGGISESRNDRKRWQKTVRATADGRITFAYHNPTNIPVDDNAIVALEYPDANAVIETTWTESVPGWPAHDLILYGTDGHMIAGGRKVTIAKPDKKSGGEVEPPALEAPRRNGPEYFIHCIHTGEPVQGMCSPENSLDAQQIMEAARLSVLSGTKIALPLVEHLYG